MKRIPKNAILLVACGLALGLSAEAALAQGVDFGKAEDLGTDFTDFVRGPLATIVFVVAFAVAGYLAAMNRISWVWVGGIVLGAVLVFGGPAFVDNFRAILS